MYDPYCMGCFLVLSSGRYSCYKTQKKLNRTMLESAYMSEPCLPHIAPSLPKETQVRFN